ncbi:MAG TPA: gliding motility-associated C-terminal domain-containing protein, partial [Saprospiraceae bacterium]
LVSQPGKYYITASNQCGEASDTVLVQFLDAPDPFILGPDTTICPGETVLLSSPSVFYDVLWQDGSGMLHLVADHAGVYWLQLSNECGVQADTLEINVHAENPILNLKPELLWCPGDQFVLDVTQSFNATYLWSTGAFTPSITVTEPGLYLVEVSSACKTVEDQSEVIPDEDCEEEVDGSPVFYIPNVFSPNDDGINDLFQVATDLPENMIAMEGRIFDRWGNLVFGSSGITFTWDGYFSGTLLNPAVFVYVITIRYSTDAGEREEVFYGDVTLLR